LRDAYVAGLFAEIWEDHHRCEVRLVPALDQFPDAQLREASAPMDFEITIADKHDRRMFAEHREWAEMLKRGQSPPVEDTKSRQESAREAIPRVCQEKVRRYFGAPHSDGLVQANLLVYVNLGAVLLPNEMVKLTEPWRKNFLSIWLLAGSDAVCTWPALQILKAVQDPFGD